MVVTVAQLYKYPKSHWILHFKWVNYVEYELHLNKPVNNYWSWPTNELWPGTLKNTLLRIKRIPVEGHALTPSCENTRIKTSCWTIIDRKTLELTKKDTPHPKTKEKPQWEGRKGAITVISNPITGGWLTHRLVNTYTTEVHPLKWRFSAPRQVSEPGGPNRRRNP